MKSKFFVSKDGGHVNKMGIAGEMVNSSLLIVQKKLELNESRKSGKDGMLLHYVLFGGSIVQ